MRRRNPSPEFEVPGSRDIAIETHPAPALQYIVGGLIPENHSREETSPSLPRFRSGLETPVCLSEAIAHHLTRLRLSLETWKQLSRRFFRSNLSDETAYALLKDVNACRVALEDNVLDTLHFLPIVERRLVQCVEVAENRHYGVYLALQPSLSIDDLSDLVADWQGALERSGAFRHAGDDEIAHLLARLDKLVGEISLTLKELAREARWLWTNEPTSPHVTVLLEWLHDLRSELHELCPVLACLEAPLRSWQHGVPQMAEDGPEAETSAGTDDALQVVDEDFSKGEIPADESGDDFDWNLDIDEDGAEQIEVAEITSLTPLQEQEPSPSGAAAPVNEKNS